MDIHKMDFQIIQKGAEIFNYLNVDLKYHQDFFNTADIFMQSLLLAFFQGALYQQEIIRQFHFRNKKGLGAAVADQVIDIETIFIAAAEKREAKKILLLDKIKFEFLIQKVGKVVIPEMA